MEQRPHVRSSEPEPAPGRAEAAAPRCTARPPRPWAPRSTRRYISRTPGSPGVARRLRSAPARSAPEYRASACAVPAASSRTRGTAAPGSRGTAPDVATQQARTSIGEHERDPLRRVARVHRQVRRPRLQHRQQRGDHLRRPRSIATATTVSGPAPAAASTRASRFARSFSSRVTSPHPPRSPPPPHPATRAARASNSSGTVPAGTGATGLIPPASTCARSASPSTCTCAQRGGRGRAPARRPGRQAACAAARTAAAGQPAPPHRR